MKGITARQWVQAGMIGMLFWKFLLVLALWAPVNNWFSRLAAVIEKSFN